MGGCSYLMENQFLAGLWKEMFGCLGCHRVGGKRPTPLDIDCPISIDSVACLLSDRGESTGHAVLFRQTQPLTSQENRRNCRWI